MKVLMLGWELPPYNSGGLGVVCHQLCKALSKRNVDIEFVLPYSAKHDIDFMHITHAHPQGVTEVLKAGIAYDSYKYIYHDGHEEWIDIYGQQQLYEQAVGQMVEDPAFAERFDIIHAHDWLTARAGLAAKMKTGKPLIIHMHSVESDRAGGQPSEEGNQDGSGNPLVREIEKISLHLADRIIAVSEHTKQTIIRDYAIPTSKIDVVHNSIEKSDLPALTEGSMYTYLTALKSNGWRVVVSVGRLTVMKGLPNLLKAAQLAIAKSPKMMFVIVGAGEQYHELIDLAATLGIGANILFTGFQRGQAWRDAFAIGDLFVMPSVSEPFGLTPLEAIMYGTPSLISKQSGVSEVLQNCLKVDFWDVDELANKIVAAVDNPPLRTELVNNMRREYDRLSWDDSIDKLQLIYSQHVPHATQAMVNYGVDA